MRKLSLLFFIIVSITVFAKNNIPPTAFTEYKFDAKQCKLILHNQSRIFVPAYTFYLDGKLYDGEVNLKYREFTDQLDIVLNNIPMNYNENDKHHVLESAGMFELYANNYRLHLIKKYKCSWQQSLIWLAEKLLF